MSRTLEWFEKKEKDLLCRSYSRYPLAIVSGHGCMVEDQDGKKYLDLLAGIAVAALGHCNPEVCDALDRQARKLWQVSNLFYQEEQLELAEILLSTTHLKKAFFCNSGAEANEACIKLARRYMRKVKKRDAFEIISLEGAFHGRTLGALAATGRPSLSDGFQPLPEGFRQVPAHDLDALDRAITDQTAAVIVECIQGEGGVIPLAADYLQGVEAICRRREILLICDEIQTGLCRTGKFWAYEHAGIRPDAISAAKGLANGLAMGAMLASDEMARGFDVGSHATTFGGGALTSAVAKKVIEIMLRDHLADHAAALGGKVLEKARRVASNYPQLVADVRGLGLMIGIEFAKDGKLAWQRLLERGFICNLSHGKTLRLLPPLIIGEKQMDDFLLALEDVCRELAD